MLRNHCLHQIEVMVRGLIQGARFVWVNLITAQHVQGTVLVTVTAQLISENVKMFTILCRAGNGFPVPQKHHQISSFVFLSEFRIVWRVRVRKTIKIKVYFKMPFLYFVLAAFSLWHNTHLKCWAHELSCPPFSNKHILSKVFWTYTDLYTLFFFAAVQTGSFVGGFSDSAKRKQSNGLRQC